MGACSQTEMSSLQCYRMVDRVYMCFYSFVYMPALHQYASENKVLCGGRFWHAIHLTKPVQLSYALCVTCRCGCVRVHVHVSVSGCMRACACVRVSVRACKDVRVRTTCAQCASRKPCVYARVVRWSVVASPYPLGPSRSLSSPGIKERS